VWIASQYEPQVIASLCIMRPQLGQGIMFAAGVTGLEFITNLRCRCLQGSLQALRG
jgi:hypothetical protein